MKYLDVVVIGSGPAGQKAAVQASKAGNRVALIEQDPFTGGHCVHRGTIPSKTLRENALRVKNLKANAELFDYKLPDQVEMSLLINHLDQVLKAHDQYMQKQMDRNIVLRIHGKAKFESPNEISVTRVRGDVLTIQAKNFVIATGSIPQPPSNVQVDHEYILDSDSILSMLYLPPSLVVIGGGIVGCEYASMFQALGVQVTLVDSQDIPLAFLDSDLAKVFLKEFKAAGGQWVGNVNIDSISVTDFSHVTVCLSNGEEVVANKALVATGRIADVESLDIDVAGVTLNDDRVIEVNERLQTNVHHIYAAGDVIGPPALASSSMEQGRRASCNALGIEINGNTPLVPTGVYSIPEMASVGLTEQEAKEKFEKVLVGKAEFKEIARGQINGDETGMLKLVTDKNGKKLLGVQIIGEGSTELIHIGQMAIVNQNDVDILVDNIFNFPTLAEAYRVAALDIVGQRAKLTNLYLDSRSDGLN